MAIEKGTTLPPIRWRNKEEGQKALLIEIAGARAEVGPVVQKRVEELKSNKDLFSELCFLPHDRRTTLPRAG